MHSRAGGWRGTTRTFVTALAGLGLLACLAVLLPRWGLIDDGTGLARVAGAAAALLAAGALLQRARRFPFRAALGWYALAASAVWLGGAAAYPSVLEPGSPLILPVSALVIVGTWKLPRPEFTTGDRTRTALDAAGAAMAAAIAMSEGLLQDDSPLLDRPVTVVSHTVLDVLLVAVGAAVIARSRRPGGLRLAPLVLCAVAPVLLVLADVLTLQGGGRAEAAALTTLTLLLWALAGVSGRTGDPGGDLIDVESDRHVIGRERIAVLTPLLPLALAAALLGGSTVLGEPIQGAALVYAGTLVLTLICGMTLTRLESLETERRLDQLVLRRTLSIGEREKWFRALVRNSSDVITVVDVRGAVRFQTPSVTRVLGHDPSDIVGTRITRLLRPVDARRLEAALAEAARTPGHSMVVELAMWATDGSWRETETTITSLLHDADVRGLVLNTRDVSERRRLEEALTAQAQSDELTGLANRSVFRSRVAGALQVALGQGEVAVLFLDLNGFKAVNDVHGHHVGDELLTVVARRLAGSIRPGDLVARLGGDEFAILVAGPDAETGARWVAERINQTLQQPLTVQGRSVTIGASIGVAVADSGDETADQLLRNADLAMYRAKSGRVPGFVRFEAQMHDALLARVKAEAELRHAIPAGQLTLHYQPVVELGSNRIVGAEALVRWEHPEIGLISPEEFIDIAEETGLITELGEWALRESARQGALWQGYAPPGGPFRIAVNVSAQQFHPGLPRLVYDVLTDSGLPGPALTLEMTETVLIDRTEDIVRLLSRIKALGVRVAVDDFGTGYSSLSYLAKFPVDLLKIDKSFVRRLGEPGGQGELVRTIVRLGESLNLATVAEGIETPHQRSALEDMGCTLGQGYLFAPPMPAERIEELLARQAAGERVPA